jgi:hypothetical protein
MLSRPTLLKEERQVTLKKLVARVCEEQGVKVTFIGSRRLSDTVTCVLNGPRDLVLPLPMMIFECLEQEELEVVSSKQEGINYLLQLVITPSLERQFSQTPERRAKLRH